MTHRANLSAALLLACCALLGAADTPLTLVGIAPDTGISASDGLTRDGALTVSGVALPGQAVALKAGSTSIGGATTDATGAWTIVLAAPLAAGQHTLTAATGSGLGARTSSLVIRIDTTAPAAPTALVCSPDTGSSASDFITNAEAPAIAGKSEAGAVVRLRLSTAASSVEAATTADAQGAWSVALPPLAEGVWTVEAIVADVAGNEATFAALKTLTIDRRAPPAPTFATLSPDTGVAGDWLTSATAPRVGGAAPEAVSVTVTVDDGAPTQASLSNGAWSATLPTQQPGLRTLAASAVDRAGNRSAAGQRQLEIRTQAVAPTLAFAGDTGAVGDRLTADATLVFSGTAEPGAGIVLSIDGAAAGTATADVAGAWSIDRTQQTLADGARTVVAKATDRAGLTASTTLVITVDTRGPAAVQDIVLRPEGGQPGEVFTADRRIAISGRADPDVDVVVIVDDQTLAVLRSDAVGAFDGAFGPLASGRHGLVVYARDAALNFGPPSATLDLLVESGGPVGGMGVVSVEAPGVLPGQPIPEGADFIVVYRGVYAPHERIIITDLQSGYRIGEYHGGGQGADGQGRMPIPGLPVGTYGAVLSDGLTDLGQTFGFVVGAGGGGGGGGGQGPLPQPIILSVRSAESEGWEDGRLAVDVEFGHLPNGGVATVFVDGNPWSFIGASGAPLGTSIVQGGLQPMHVAALPAVGGTLTIRIWSDLNADGLRGAGEEAESPPYVVDPVVTPEIVVHRIEARDGGTITDLSPLTITGDWVPIQPAGPDLRMVVILNQSLSMFEDEGQMVWSVPATPGPFQLNLPAMPSGAYQVVVGIATQNGSIYNPITTTVPRTVVVQAPILLGGAESAAEPGRRPIAGRPWRLRGTAARPVEGTLRIFVDGQPLDGADLPLGQLAAGSPWAVEVATPLPGGQHSIRALVMEQGGQRTNTTQELPVYVEGDLPPGATPPRILGVSPSQVFPGMSLVLAEFPSSTAGVVRATLDAQRVGFARADGTVVDTANAAGAGGQLAFHMPLEAGGQLVLSLWWGDADGDGMEDPQGRETVHSAPFLVSRAGAGTGVWAPSIAQATMRGIGQLVIVQAAGAMPAEWQQAPGDQIEVQLTSTDGSIVYGMGVVEASRQWLLEFALPMIEPPRNAGVAARLRRHDGTTSAWSGLVLTP